MDHESSLCVPRFEFRYFGFADDDDFGNGYGELQLEFVSEPEVDVADGFVRHDELPVGAEEDGRVELLHDLIERGVQRVFLIPVGDDFRCLVFHVEAGDVADGQRQQLVLMGDEEIGSVGLLLLLQFGEDGGDRFRVNWWRVAGSESFVLV